MKGDYGYVFLVRMGQDGVRFVDSWMDVSPYVNKRFREFVASQQVKARLLGQAQPDMNEVLRGIKSLSTMKLRARFNMMDGPLYVRTEDPMTYDELNTLVASKSNDEYQKFVKRFKAKF
jgi:hypothetical protein